MIMTNQNNSLQNYSNGEYQSMELCLLLSEYPNDYSINLFLRKEPLHFENFLTIPVDSHSTAMCWHTSI